MDTLTSSSAEDELLNTVTPFLCDHVQRYLKEHDHNVPLLPVAKECFSAVVMADVSGYSTLTSNLAEKGSIGAELLSKTMNGYLDKVISIIRHWGGDLVKFAGDAVIFCWTLDVEKSDRDEDDDTDDESNNAEVETTTPNDHIERGEIVLRACECCLQLLTDLGEYKIDLPDIDIKVLRIHLGIGAGTLFDVHVGGGPGRWEHLIAGEAINQLGTVLDLAKPGQLAISHQALRWFTVVIDLESLNLGAYDKRCIILTEMDKKVRRVKPKPWKRKDPKFITCNFPTEELYRLYKNYVSVNAIYKLNSGFKNLTSLSELRQVTTIFIKISSIRFTSESCLGQAQDAMDIVQTVLKKQKGSLRQFIVDDKGAVLLCYFGNKNKRLPPYAHENNSLVGLKAAIQIRFGLLNVFEEFSIGVSTGMAWCGGIGNTARSDYAVVGDSINMAARLMCNKNAKQGVLCDELTYSRCHQSIALEDLGKAKVKGKQHAIGIFRPKCLDEDQENARTFLIMKNEVVGKMPDIESVSTDILNSIEIEKPRVIFMEGDVHQAYLIVHFVAHKNATKMYHCSTQCGEANGIIFYSYRSLLQNILNITNKTGSSELESDQRQSRLSLKKRISFIKGDLGSSMDTNVGKLSLPSGSRPSVDGGDVTSAPNLYIKRLSLTPDMEMAIRKNKTASMSAQQDNLLSTKRYSSLEKYIQAFKLSALKILLPKSVDEALGGEPFVIDTESKEDLRDTMVKLFNGITQEKPITVTFRHAEEKDEYSWWLTNQILQLCHKVNFIFISSSNVKFTNKEIEEIKKNAPANVIAIKPSTKQDVKELIHQLTEVEKIDGEVIEEIWTKCQANLSLAKRILDMNLDSERYEVHESQLQLKDKITFDSFLPGTQIENIIIAEFDKLNPGFQRFLRMASIMGGKFWDIDVFVLTDSTWMTTDDVVIYDLYGFLTTTLSKGGEKRLCAFTSAQIQDCIYQMISFEHRKKMHSEVAQYFENLYLSVMDILALIPAIQNYEACQNEDKTFELLSHACEHFYQKRMWSHVIEYQHKYLKMIRNKEDKRNDREIIADCHFALGEAYYATSCLDDAEKFLLQALKSLDFEIAKGKVSIKLQKMQNTFGIMRRRSISASQRATDETGNRRDKIRRILLLLSKVEYQRENRMQCKASLVPCIDISSKHFTKDWCFAEANALQGLLYAENKKKIALSTSCFNISKITLEIDPKRASVITCMMYEGVAQFLLGSQEKFNEIYGKYSSYFNSAKNHDVEWRFFTAIKILNQYHEGHFKQGLATVSELQGNCTKAKDNYGLWISHCLNLLHRIVDHKSHPSLIPQVLKLIQNMDSVCEKQGTPGMKLLHYGLSMEANLILNSSVDIWSFIQQGSKILSRISTNSYMVMPGIERYLSAIFLANDSHLLDNDENARKNISEFLVSTSSVLTLLSRFRTSKFLIGTIKGLLSFLEDGKLGEAVKLWEKTLNSEEEEKGTVYLRAFLFAKLSKLHSDKEKQKEHETSSRKLCEQMNIKFESMYL